MAKLSIQEIMEAIKELTYEKAKEIFVDIDGINNLSELLGSSYRHLNRVIKNLSDLKIIEKNKNTIKILNLEKLTLLAQDIYKN